MRRIEHTARSLLIKGINIKKVPRLLGTARAYWGGLLIFFFHSYLSLCLFSFSSRVNWRVQLLPSSFSKNVASPRGAPPPLRQSQRAYQRKFDNGSTLFRVNSKNAPKVTSKSIPVPGFE